MSLYKENTNSKKITVWSRSSLNESNISKYWTNIWITQNIWIKIYPKYMHILL